jgi:hypothetical protein
MQEKIEKAQLEKAINLLPVGKSLTTATTPQVHNRFKEEIFEARELVEALWRTTRVERLRDILGLLPPDLCVLESVIAAGEGQSIVRENLVVARHLLEELKV